MPAFVSPAATSVASSIAREVCAAQCLASQLYILIRLCKSLVPNETQESSAIVKTSEIVKTKFQSTLCNNFADMLICCYADIDMA